MNELIRKLRVRIENAITRAVVDRGDGTGRFLQLLWAGDRVSADVEHLEPQGLHFSPPADASAVLLSPGGSRAGVIALGAGGDTPPDTLKAGEGGLHYLGAWRVFLKEDGTLALGALEPDDFVALASKVDAEIDKLKADVQAIVDLLTGSSTPPWVVVPMDGGAALAAAAATALATVPSSAESVASATVKVQS